MQKGMFEHLTTTMVILLIFFGYATTGRSQQIEAKLPGTTSAVSFHVKDQNGNMLFTVFGDGKVAAGTTSPGNAQVTVTCPSTRVPIAAVGSNSEATIVAANSNSAATSAGIRGEGAIGVQGVSTAGIGVQGEANNPDKFGVYGFNNSTTGPSVGVKGWSESSLGVGVVGGCAQGFGVQGYGVTGVTGTSATNAGGYGVAGFGDTGLSGYGFRRTADCVCGQGSRTF